MTSNGIEIDGLVREFKGGIRAVDGIELRVEPGEIYGFLGPNGAGKSTTVLMLTTLLPPTAGTARVGGYDIVREGPQVRASIGAALQEAALDPLLTGREHLKLQTSLQGLPKAERARRGDELLERVGLVDAADRKVRGYSGGMKRRLDLALALVHSPRILFLDEPTTGLDPQSRADLWEEVSRLAHSDGVTVMLTTQYLEEADALADRIGIIDHGRIVAEGTPDGPEGRGRAPEPRGHPRRPGPARRRRRRARALRRPGGRAPPAPSPCAWTAAPTTSQPWCARSTPRASGSITSSCTRRRSTTSSWPRPGASSRPTTAPRRTTRPSATRSPYELRPARAGRRDGGPLDPPDAAPAGADHPADRVPADPAGRQRRRARRRDEDPRLPGRHLPRLRDRGLLPAGRPVRDDQRGLEPGARRRDGLPQAPRADADEALRAAAREPRRGDDGRGRFGADLPRRRPGRRPRRQGGRGRRARPAAPRDADRARLRRARRAGRPAHRLRRGGAGLLPALLRRCSSCPR